MKKLFLFFGIFLLYSHPYLLAQDLESLYQKARQFYKDSNYTQAIKHLQALDSDDDNSVYRKKRADLTKQVFERMDDQKKSLEIAKFSLIAQTDKLNLTVKTLKTATQNAVKSLLLDATKIQDQDPWGALEKISTAKSLSNIPPLAELEDHIKELNRLIGTAYQKLGAATKKNILRDLDKGEDTLKARIAHLPVLDSILNFSPDSIVFARNALINSVLGRIDDTLSVFKFAAALRLSKLLKPIEEGADSRICTHFEVAFCYTVLGKLKAAEQVLDSISSDLPASVCAKILAFKQVDSLQKLPTLRALIQLQSPSCSENISERYLPQKKFVPIPTGATPVKGSPAPSQPFLMSSVEVSFFEYDLFCLATHRALSVDNGWGRGKRPAIDVSWYDAIAYCNWKSELEGLNPAYLIIDDIMEGAKETIKVNFKSVSLLAKSNGYRLPDVAEWQFAAGNGQNNVYSWGNDFPPQPGIENLSDSLTSKLYPIFIPVANYRDPFPTTAPIGSFAKNHFGLYDMCGNVWEWCWNLCGESSDCGPSQNKKYRVIRGGSWSSDAESYQITSKNAFDPASSNYSIGFRIVKNN